MSITKRDLHADLDICDVATDGPWELDYDYETRKTRVKAVIEPEWLGGVIVADCAHDVDTRFIVEARTGWPHAIKRALEAERMLAMMQAKVERMRQAFGNSLVYTALVHYTDMHIDSDERPDDWDTVFDARLEAFKLMREAENEHTKEMDKR